MNSSTASPFKEVFKKADLEFDYETNNIRLEESQGMEGKLYVSGIYNTEKILNFNNFWDKRLDASKEEEKKIEEGNRFKANCLKRLVSQKKKRFQNEKFDLDLAYVTKRVIAMGYPSNGCETIYRNNLVDVMSFMEEQHKHNVKIYNLCIEPDRIYSKSVFKGLPVGLFPSKDHNPCPVKLILELCVDLTIFLTKNSEAVAAIHCKAGKGRTGVMICCYLIFSGLCKNTDEAVKYYGEMRTLNGKGVTISSQIRFIQYFETYLTTNFHAPYYNCIPKMAKYHINVKTTNMIRNYIKDTSYFVSPNSFALQYIKIGPFTSQKSLDIKIQDFLSTDFKKLLESKSRVQRVDAGGETVYFYILEFCNKVAIRSDVKVNVNSFGVKFYFWLNLWYSALDLIKLFIDEVQEECHLKIPSSEQRCSHPKLKPTSSFHHKKLKQRESKAKKFEVEMKNIFSTNLKEELLDDASSQSSSTNIVKKDSKQNKNNKNFSSFGEEGSSEEVKKSDSIEESMGEKQLNEEISLYNQPNLPDSSKSQIDQIFELIDHLNHETDLSSLIDNINKVRNRAHKKMFNKTELLVSLSAEEVDKFSTAKKQHKDFAVDISFQLL